MDNNNARLKEAIDRQYGNNTVWGENNSVAVIADPESPNTFSAGAVTRWMNRKKLGSHQQLVKSKSGNTHLIWLLGIKKTKKGLPTFNELFPNTNLWSHTCKYFAGMLKRESKSCKELGCKKRKPGRDENFSPDQNRSSPGSMNGSRIKENTCSFSTNTPPYGVTEAYPPNNTNQWPYVIQAGWSGFSTQQSSNAPAYELPFGYPMYPSYNPQPPSLTTPCYYSSPVANHESSGSYSTNGSSSSSSPSGLSPSYDSPSPSDTEQPSLSTLDPSDESDSDQRPSMQHRPLPNPANPISHSSPDQRSHQYSCLSADTMSRLEINENACPFSTNAPPYVVTEAYPPNNTNQWPYVIQAGWSGFSTQQSSNAPAYELPFGYPMYPSYNPQPPSLTDTCYYTSPVANHESSSGSYSANGTASSSSPSGLSPSYDSPSPSYTAQPSVSLKRKLDPSGSDSDQRHSKRHRPSPNPANPISHSSPDQGSHQYSYSSPDSMSRSPTTESAWLTSTNFYHSTNAFPDRNLEAHPPNNTNQCSTVDDMIHYSNNNTSLPSSQSNLRDFSAHPVSNPTANEPFDCFSTSPSDNAQLNLNCNTSPMSEYGSSTPGDYSVHTSPPFSQDSPDNSPSTDDIVSSACEFELELFATEDFYSLEEDGVDELRDAQSRGRH